MHRRADLVRELRALGLAGCALVMLHASLRRLGPVEGGASAILDALFDAMAPGATLLMTLGADEDLPFDALTTPAEKDVGALAEIFRQRAGTRVNDHASARFAASGPRSLVLLEPMPLHDYYGPGSVLSRFAAWGGSVLRLGADPNTVTLTHWAEYLAAVPGKRRVRRRSMRADTGEQWIECLDDSDGIREWPQGDYFSQILLDFIAAGKARRGPVGGCDADLLPAPAFVAFAVAWMEKHLA